MERERKLVFYVNGVKVLLYTRGCGPNLSEHFYHSILFSVTTIDFEPEESLAKYLRKNLYLTGTKIGCNQGGCGTCTVMLSTVDRSNGEITHAAVNACLVPVASVHGCAVTTVEGIGNSRTRLHDVQERLAKSHGTQCGYCSPGMVMSMYALLRNNPNPSELDIEEAIGGNLCRCTGYRPILAAFRTLSQEGCCRAGKECCQSRNESSEEGEKTTGNHPCHTAVRPSQEPIFPPELQLSDELDRQSLEFRGKNCVWFRPTSLDELWQLKTTEPSATLVAGNNHIGVDMHLFSARHPVLISLDHVQELYVVRDTDCGVEFGASTTVTRFIEALSERVDLYPPERTRFFKGILVLMKRFASKQIRNTATIGGSVISALRGFSKSDVITCLAGCNCSVLFQHKDRSMETVLLDADLLDNTNVTNINRLTDDVTLLVKITVPFSNKNEYFFTYKQSERSTADFAVVNAAMTVCFRESSREIDCLRLAYGGVGQQTFISKKSSNFFGKSWDELLVDKVNKAIIDEIVGLGLKRDDYQLVLVASLFFRFYMQVSNTFCSHDYKDTSSFSKTSQLPSRATQLFEDAPNSQPDTDPVGRPLAHKASIQHATGEAIFVDDTIVAPNELHMRFVRSSKARARITFMDASKALNMAGVKYFLSHKDVPDGKNDVLSPNTELLASLEVHGVGQAIGAIVADSIEHAQEAAKAVVVCYEEHRPLLELKEAIELESFYGDPIKLEQGDVGSNWENCDHVVEGEVTMGNQEHFYMETNAVIVRPSGEDELDVLVSCQSPHGVQEAISKVLGVQRHKVYVRTKRVGGAFGGKESYICSMASLTALASKILNQPVRCLLDRDEDMAVTGNRIDFLGKYKIGVTSDGKILCYEATIYGHQGFQQDVGHLLVEKGVATSDASYNIPHFSITGRVVKSNRFYCTAFRGFGSPEALLITESAVCRAASTLGIPFEEMQRMNLYEDGDVTPTGVVLENCNIKQCWDVCYEKCDYESRRQEIIKFNRDNRWKKRGMAFTTTKFPIGFPSRVLNQAGALIHVYLDGSVLLSHGGIEIGQGIHTKMIQVASRALGIPHSLIHVADTSIDKVPNPVGTYASVTADLNGAAVLNACSKLKSRLQPYVDSQPDGTWVDWVRAANMDQVQLSATGFYRDPSSSYTLNSKTGKACFYFTCGVGCSEVEIDCLTGDHRLIRTDIVMDVGKSLNPAIDIGQIEGGFMQGYGWCTMEKLKVNDKGEMISNGPANYKIPTVGQVPREFNVTLLKVAPYTTTVYSSKGIGEPPLHLGISVFFAIKNAISAARGDAGMPPNDFCLNHPATVEEIRMACPDKFIKQVVNL